MSSTQIYLSIIFVRKGMLQFEMEGHCLRWHERLEDYCRIDTDRVTLWWGRQAWIDSKTMCCNTEKDNQLAISTDCTEKDPPIQHYTHDWVTEKRNMLLIVTSKRTSSSTLVYKSASMSFLALSTAFFAVFSSVHINATSVRQADFRWPWSFQ